MSGKIIPALTTEAGLKRALRRHLAALGFEKKNDTWFLPSEFGKEAVRRLHSPQRAECLQKNRAFISAYLPTVAQSFARGAEVNPSEIRLSLQRVYAGTWEAIIFRLAALTWSIPVSGGYGRRLRYLVWDASNNKLVGLIGLGDPVFNLSCRDRYIGWDVPARVDKLVNVLDAYVLGAVPPYNLLLGGKAVACLLRTREIYDDFRRTYGAERGIISGIAKNPRLLAITTSSALGRSSVYNRLRLDGISYLNPIGYTEGWGHFHIPDQLFNDMRKYLRQNGHRYADEHRFGQGPNWRLRTIRVGLKALGFDEGLLRHGIQREVFICELAANAREILTRRASRPDITRLNTVQEVSHLAVKRWMIPRAESFADYKAWEPVSLNNMVRLAAPAIAGKSVQLGFTQKTRSSLR